MKIISGANIVGLIVSFTTILVGNGLGRAIDNNFFDLQNAIESRWHSGDDLISAQAKESILQCLANGEKTEYKVPTSENDLLMLQEAVAACQVLLKMEKSKEVWLSPFGREFPDIVNQFIGKTAFHFHTFKQEDLPENYKSFLKSIKKFIQGRKCHLATLIYDNLLYQPLILEKVLNGYNGNLLDGFWSSGYDESNMIRTSNPDQGWYLHLHGSPLFYSDNGSIKKLSQSELLKSFTGAIKRRHLVLTHITKKSSLIASSYLLNSYFQLFGQALGESDHLVVFGYSGADDHINSRIKDWVTLKKSIGIKVKISIIERKKEGDRKKRIAFWKSCFVSTNKVGITPSLIDKHESILDFDWMELNQSLSADHKSE